MSVNENALGSLVVARFSDGRIAGVGQCLVYVDSPTVMLRNADGKEIRWRADMCEELDIDKEIVQLFMPNPTANHPKET